MVCQRNNQLSVKDLYVEFQTATGIVSAVNGVNLEIPRGKITALVGESGSGKSVTSLAIMGLLPYNGKVTKGSIQADGQDFQELSGRQREQLNGTVLGMIFQDPSASLDPLYTVGDQMVEGIVEHQRISRQEAREKAEAYLESVHLPTPHLLMGKYPFELSGGMCQRVMIAATMALQPRYLIADEPTTALDVTVQRQILTEIYRLSRLEDVGVLFITHDLGVVAEIADQVSIMQHGEIVEAGEVDRIFHHPSHLYTRQLLNAIL